MDPEAQAPAVEKNEEDAYVLDASATLDFQVIDPRFVADRQRKLTVSEGFGRMSLETSDDLTVEDENGDVIFRMDAAAGGTDNKRILYDQEGKAVASMTRRTATLHKRWWLFKGTNTDQTSPDCVKLAEFTATIIGGTKIAPKINVDLSDSTKVTIHGGLLAKKFTVFSRTPSRAVHFTTRGADNALTYYGDVAEDGADAEAAVGQGVDKLALEEPAAAGAGLDGDHDDDEEEDSSSSSDDDDSQFVDATDDLMEEQVAQKVEEKKPAEAKKVPFGAKIQAKLERIKSNAAAKKQAKREAAAKAQAEKLAAMAPEERAVAEAKLAEKAEAARVKQEAKDAKDAAKVTKALEGSPTHGHALAFIKKQGTVGTLLQGDFAAVAWEKVSMANRYFVHVKPGADLAFIVCAVMAADEMYHDPSIIKALMS